jgi:hypothetical protein
MTSGAAFDSTGVIQKGYNFYTLTTDGTTANVYVNGVLFNSEQVNLGSVNINELGIGNRQLNNTLFLDGQIAGFKIFNTALTAEQVADLYNNPEKVVPTGVDNTALKLWLPMMEGAGTTAFNGAPDALGSELITNGDFSDGTNNWTATHAVISAANNQLIVDDSTNLGGDSRATQTFTTEVGKKYRLVFTKISTTSFFFLGIGAGSSYNNIFYSNIGQDSGIHTIEFTATSTTTTLSLITGGVGISVFANVSIKQQTGFGTISGATWTNGIGAPVAQTSVIDWNKASDGTNEVLLPQGLTTGRDITGVNLFENVRKQGALNLDGNSWAEVHDNESLDVTTGLSIENWIYIEDAATQGRILSKWGSSQPNRSFQMFMNNAVVRFLIGDGSSQASLNSSTSLTEGNWHHIVSTYDGANIKIYINGSADATTTETFTIYNSNEPVLIGGYIGGTILSVNPIAQPRIYNRALTASEVLQNYNSGKNTYTND